MQISIDLYDKNRETYGTKYQEGYGLVYPDGHVIRVYHQILEYELGLHGGNILDYGCGTGAHLKFFELQGFTPYGCDIDPIAIDKCKALMPAYADNFRVTPYSPNLRDFFDVDFDLLFANQVLYYLTDKDMADLISQFYGMGKAGSVLFATMLSAKNRRFLYVTDTIGEMQKIELHEQSGRLSEDSYVNYKAEEEIIKFFQPFQKLHMGYYGHKIREDEGPSEHYLYVGRK